MAPIHAPDRETALVKKLLEIVQEAGVWISRREIAEKSGQTRLNPYDVAILERLVTEGRIEAGSRPLGKVRSERVYRSK